MNEFELARHWANPANWTLGVFYRAVPGFAALVVPVGVLVRRGVE